MFATKVRLQRNIPEYRYFNMWQKWHVCPEARLQIIVVTNKSRNLVSYYQVSNYKISNYRKIKTPTILVCVFDPISRTKIRKTTNFQIFEKGFGRGNVGFSQFRWLQLDLVSHWLMDLQADHWQALISMILKEFRKCFDVWKEWIDRFLVEDSIEDCRHLKSRFRTVEFTHKLSNRFWSKLGRVLILNFTYVEEQPDEANFSVFVEFSAFWLVHFRYLMNFDVASILLVLHTC